MANIPGIKVISCIDPADAKGLLKSAIRDDDPVCVMESESFYGLKGEIPDRKGSCEKGRHRCYDCVL